MFSSPIPTSPDSPTGSPSGIYNIYNYTSTVFVNEVLIFLFSLSPGLDESFVIVITVTVSIIIVFISAVLLVILLFVLKRKRNKSQPEAQ